MARTKGAAAMPRPLSLGEGALLRDRAGGKRCATAKTPLISSKNYEIILSKDLEKLYARYQTCIGIAQLP